MVYSGPDDVLTAIQMSKLLGNSTDGNLNKWNLELKIIYLKVKD